MWAGSAHALYLSIKYHFHGLRLIMRPLEASAGLTWSHFSFRTARWEE